MQYGEDEDGGKEYLYCCFTSFFYFHLYLCVFEDICATNDMYIQPKIIQGGDSESDCSEQKHVEVDNAARQTPANVESGSKEALQEVLDEVAEQKLSSMNTSPADDVSTMTKTPTTTAIEQQHTNNPEDIRNIPGAHHIGGSSSANNENDDNDNGRAGSVLYFPGDNIITPTYESELNRLGIHSVTDAVAVPIEDESNSTVNSPVAADCENAVGTATASTANNHNEEETPPPIQTYHAEPIPTIKILSREYESSNVKGLALVTLIVLCAIIIPTAIITSQSKDETTTPGPISPPTNEEIDIPSEKDLTGVDNSLLSYDQQYEHLKEFLIRPTLDGREDWQALSAVQDAAIEWVLLYPKAAGQDPQQQQWNIPKFIASGNNYMPELLPEDFIRENWVKGNMNVSIDWFMERYVLGLLYYTVLYEYWFVESESIVSGETEEELFLVDHCSWDSDVVVCNEENRISKLFLGKSMKRKRAVCVSFFI